MSTDPRTRAEDAHWQAQECGRRAAMAPPAAPMDADSRDYLQIAQALRTLPRSAPPADFATTVARQVTPRRSVGLERWLLPPLFVALAVTLSAAAAAHARTWWQAIEHALTHDGGHWLLACGLCALATWAIRPLLRYALHHAGAIPRAPGRARLR
ncbi:hypothetical protein [Stenotrophomonas maltophilia]|jgi:hypothetical protein|uniref:Transmembrane protein n=1 Tax=Stenotrophomonas maltophilia TaxID=40324 RepID=A0A4S2CY55_STEMA|nr:hypothetical protein [Stenotrophomonas maltophilia]TGY33023.1 hypothetical protein E5352_13910 [Stenotrophomonas maltophilia]